MKIIVFPFSGGNKFSFTALAQNLPGLVILEYPGRGIRVNEKLLDDVTLLIENLWPTVIEEINSCDKYIIYGHSMGALIGYLICHKITETGLKKPLKLIISGREAPAETTDEVLADLPDDLFWEEVIKMGGVPDALRNSDELMKFYLPILKADFKAIEEYKHTAREKLTIPIDVFYGSEEGISESQITGWKEETTQRVVIKQLKGNHFFIYDHEDFFVNYFNNLSKKLIY